MYGIFRYAILLMVEFLVSLSSSGLDFVLCKRSELFIALHWSLVEHRMPPAVLPHKFSHSTL